MGRAARATGVQALALEVLVSSRTQSAEPRDTL